MMTQGPQLDAFQSAGAVPKQLRGAITYAAGTTGAIGATTLFTVTGDVRIERLAAKCTTDLTSAGVPTFDLGVTGNTAAFNGTTFPDATGWDVGKWINGVSFGYTVGAAPPAVGGATYSFDVSANIIQTIATATITGGVVRWYLSYIPLSGDGKVELHANLVAF